jgi:hypothetical protein
LYSDDYADERNEILADQGQALPFTKGFHLVGQLVGAMCPEDLDAMDESIPLTKYALDNLLGMDSTPEDYRHYFSNFVNAQRMKKPESQVEIFKARQNWEQFYQQVWGCFYMCIVYDCAEFDADSGCCSV